VAARHVAALPSVHARINLLPGVVASDVRGR
jgi:hypothetical protein